MNIRPVDNINFGAIPIAQAKLRSDFITLSQRGLTPIAESEIGKIYKLFKITKNDMPFIRGFKKSLCLPELAPGYKKLQYNVWSFLISLGLADSIYENSERILCAYDDKPCGVLNYSSSYKDTISVNYVATWPVEKGKKVPLANQVSFCKLFRNCIRNGMDHIYISAIPDSPGNPIEKYQQLGFNPFEDMPDTEISMIIDSEQMKYSLKNLNKKMEMEEYTDRSEINLYEELDIVV